MDVGALQEQFTAFVRAHQVWAPVIVGLLAFGESLAVVSIFIPATVMLLGIGALIGSAELAFWPIWFGAAVGATLGDWVSYEVGRYFEDGLKSRWPLNRSPQVVERAEAFVQRYGAVGVFIGRFSGPLRAIVPLVAGIFEMPRLTFQIANVTSALVWAYLLLGAGDVFGEMGSRFLKP